MRIGTVLLICFFVTTEVFLPIGVIAYVWKTEGVVSFSALLAVFGRMTAAWEAILAAFWSLFGVSESVASILGILTNLAINAAGLVVLVIFGKRLFAMRKRIMAHLF